MYLVIMMSTETYLQTRDHNMTLAVGAYCNGKHVSALIFCWVSSVYSGIALYLPYFALYLPLNIRILPEDQPSELIDGCQIFEFFKTKLLISKNDVSSVRENSKNIASTPGGRAIELRIIFFTIFP